MMHARFVLLTLNCHIYFDLEHNILSFISLNSQRKMLSGSINHVKFDQ